MSGPNPERALLGVPDRWMGCPKTGKIVENLFFPFKAPMCRLYDDQVAPRNQFHPNDVFKHPFVQGKKIGLWIDLTNTDRFYYVDEVQKNGAQYRKLKMAGHKQSPSVEETDQFIRLVNGFVKDHPGQLVAVHCTHGFNRTGFVISAYMNKILDWPIDSAIQQFAAARPCGIYKQEYINDLFKRYGDGDDDVIEAPQKPSWEYGEDNSLDESVPTTSGTNNADNTQPGKKGKVFMDGQVPNVYHLEDQSKKRLLQGKIKEMCRYKNDGFPGLQPVSLERSPDRDNLKLLAEKPYMVSWKADGMRYMILICDKDEVFAFDRDNEVFQIDNLDFPARKGGWVQDTLMDAEMIIDTLPDGVKMPRLLIYDIIHFNGIRVGKDRFDIRHACIQREIIEARNNALSKGIIMRDRQTMSVRLKHFWNIEAVGKIFSPEFQGNLGHEVDGLIFQPILEPYTSGRCDLVLKWKPPSHNSIDFKLQIKREQKEGQLVEYVGYLYVLHHSGPVFQMKATKTLQKYDNKIIECSYDVPTAQWHFMRERTDKSHPNAFNTAKAVFSSMLHPIHQQDLVDFCVKYGCRYKPPGQSQSGQPPSKRPRQ